MTMIEKVARALAIVHGADPDMLGPGQTHVALVDGINTIIGDHRGPLWTMYVPEARAAIEAMREPTKGMISDGLEAIRMNLDSTTDTNATYDIVVDGSAYYGWVAMIDAALTEPSSSTPAPYRSE